MKRKMERHIPDIFVTNVGLQDGVYVRFGLTKRRADNESFAMSGNDRNPNKETGTEKTAAQG